MCKKLIVLVFCATVLFSGATMADVDDSGRLIVPEVSVAPIIDGELDDVWQKVSEESLLITEIINATSAVPEDLNDLSATFQVMHDADNFYVYVVIQDSVIDYQFSDWNGDGVEFFFDGDNSKGSSYDGVNDNQIRITVDDVELANIDSSLPVDGSAFKVILTDLGYNIEASFPLETLQIVPENTFGFEVQLNDNDGGSGRETLIRWFSNDNNSWRDASLFGEAILVSEPEPINPGTDGLVALYALDGDVNDSSGNDLHGTIVGDPVFVEGVEGMAMDFDGVDDLVELGKFDVVGQITLAAWIKADDFEINDARVISKANEWGGNDHWWMLSTISETSLRFRLKTNDGQDTTTLISDPVLEAGVWTHVAATWDGSMMRIYKDGQEVASQEKGGSAVAVDPAVSVAIGSQPSDAFASDPSRVVKFFDGLIDDARIYDRALSEGELRYLAGERATPVDPGTDGLVAYYALENNTDDSSGNELHGTVVGEPAYVEGPVGYGTAMAFDGVDDYVDFGNDARFDITEQVSLAVWVNANDMANSEHNPWLGKGDHTYAIKHQAGNFLEFFIYDAGWNSTQYYDYDESMNGEWHHTAGTYDGSELKFYLDGEVVATLDHEGTIETREHPVTMGTNSEAGGRFYDGALDEGVIYNRALSAGEVRYLAGYRAQVIPVLTVAPLSTLEADVDPADPSTLTAVLKINGIDASALVLGTTTTDFEKWPDNPAANADNFDLTNYASLDDSTVIQTVFTQPVTTIFMMERGANDNGFFQALDADGNPVGDKLAFTNADFQLPDAGLQIVNQNAGGIAIEASAPIYGLQILPPEGSLHSIDPASISAVPAP